MLHFKPRVYQLRRCMLQITNFPLFVVIAKKLNSKSVVMIPSSLCHYDFYVVLQKIIRCSEGAVGERSICTCHFLCSLPLV